MKNRKVLLSKIMLFIILFYFINNIINMIRIQSFHTDFVKNLSISFHIKDILYTFFFTVLIFTAVVSKIKESSIKMRMSKNRNLEYGSAEWGTSKDIEPFINNNFDDNIIYTSTERLTYEIERKEFKYNRNHNSIVVGMPGTGKTWLFILSNLLQNKGSYVITDTKGSTIVNTGYFFNNVAKKEIRIFNTKNIELSMKYNPFVYIKKELDILKFTNNFINATEEVGSKKGEEFWIKAERLFLTAIIGYMFETMSYEKINIPSFLEIINKVRLAEQGNKTDEVSETVDDMFSTLEKINPESFAVRQYNKYLTGAEKTKSSIILSVCARVSILDIQEIRELMEYDELDLESISNGNTVLYIITSDSDRSLDFLNSLLYTQLIQILYEQADSLPGEKFMQPVSLFLDEFKQLRIPHFEDIISTNRSRNIPIHLLIQSTSQLKEAYKDAWSSIMGNCDNYLFLGAKEKETLKDLKETLDKSTILEKNSSKTFSNYRSHQDSEKNLGRDLMTIGELAKLPQDECIYILRGISPFRSKKYMTNKHKNYRYVYNSKTKKNIFSIEEYLEEYRRNSDKIILDNNTKVIEYIFEE